MISTRSATTSVRKESLLAPADGSSPPGVVAAARPVPRVISADDHDAGYIMDDDMALVATNMAHLIYPQCC